MEPAVALERTRAQSGGAAWRSVPSRARTELPLGAAIVAVLGVAYLILHNGGWVYDDNYILVLARSIGFGWHWLDTPIFQHWDPGMNAVYSAMLRLFPFDYRWALAAMLVALGTSMYVFDRVLRLVIGGGWITLAIVVWFGLSILWTRQLQWWAAGIQEFPTLLADLVCLYGFLRWQSERRDRWLVLSVSALAVGLSFYEKPAFMPFYLALIRVLALSDSISPRQLASGFWRERRLWLAYGAVLGIWAYGYVSSGAYAGVNAGQVSVEQYLSYFRILWVNTLVPALFGFTLPARHLNALQTLGAVAAQLGFWAVVWLALRGTRAAWRASALIAIAVALDGAVVAHTRVAQFGVAIGNDLRYLTDFAWLIPFALCWAFARGAASGDADRPRIWPGRPSIASRLRWMGGLALAAYAAASVATSAHLQEGWGSIQARHWESNLERGLARFTDMGMTPVLADNEVPFQIISYPFAPVNRLSRVAPLYAAGVQVDGPLVGPLVGIDVAGDVRRVALEDVSGDGHAEALLRGGKLVIMHGRVRASARAVCVAAGGAPAMIVRSLGRQAAGLTPRYLRLDYTVTQPLTLRVSEVAPPEPEAPGLPDPIVVSAHAHTSLLWLPRPTPSRVILSVPARHSICVRRIEVDQTTLAR